METNNSLITKSASNILKIFFECMVLFHHLYVYSGYSYGTNIMDIIGPIAIGGFLLLSGYGVGRSFLIKKDDYLKKLITKRIPYLYIVLVLANLIYLIPFFLQGGSFSSPLGLILSVLNIPLTGEYVVLSHWIYYINDLLIYYLVFYVVMMIFKKDEKRMLKTIITMIIASFLIFLVLTIINVNTGSNRSMRAIFCFSIGLLFALYNDKILPFIKEHKIEVVTICFISAILIFIFYKNLITSEYILPILFSTPLILLLGQGEYEFKWLNYISSLVIYIYVIQEFFFIIVNKILLKKVTTANTIIITVLVIITAIGLDWFIKYIQRVIEENKDKEEA